MNFRRRHKVSAEVDTSSMNDIMFFLLLFFLLTSTMVAPHIISVNLPKASTGQSVPKKNINISVSKDGSYYIDKQKVSSQELSAELSKYANSSEEVTVIINADSEAKIQPFVTLMDVASKYKLKIVVAVQNEKK